MNRRADRRRFLSLPLAAAVSPISFAQAPGAFPQRPLRIVVPFPPGGYADAMSRLLAAELAGPLGQSVVVENRAGAGGIIGAEAVAKSPGDGHTLLMGTIGTHAINPSLYRKLAYDPQRDFSPIAFVADAETVLVVPASNAPRTVSELIAQAKARPNAMSYASAGPGSTSHLVGEVFKSVTGTDLVHVPYKGNAPAMTDLVAGQVQLSFATLQTALPFIRGGRLTALATLGSQRSPTLPSVPTLEEAGVKGVAARNWIGLMAPAGTPAAVAQRLAAEVDRAMRLPETQAKLQAEGLRYQAMGPEAFAPFIRAEAAFWAGVIRTAGVQAD